MHGAIPDEKARLRAVRLALQAYMYAVEQLPYPGCLEFIHGTLKELVEKHFHIRDKAWLNPYELAHIVNYVALYVTTKKNYRPVFELTPALNNLKKLWALAENENKYSDNVDTLRASFCVGFISGFHTASIRAAL